MEWSRAKFVEKLWWYLLFHIALCNVCWPLLPEVIVITTKEIHKMMSTDPKMKLEPIKMKLDVVCIQEDGDMGTADALRHIQQKIKVCGALLNFTHYVVPDAVNLRCHPISKVSQVLVCNIWRIDTKQDKILLYYVLEMETGYHYLL